MGFFDDLLGAVNDLKEEFTEPLNDLKSVAKDAIGDLTSTASDVTQSVTDLKQGAQDKMKSFSDIVKK